MESTNITVAGIHNASNDYQYEYISNHEIMRHTNKFVNSSYTSINNDNFLFVGNISGIHRITMNNANPDVIRILDLPNSWVSDIYFGQMQTNGTDRLVYFTTGNTRVLDDQNGNEKANTVNELYWGNINSTEDDISIIGSLILDDFVQVDDEDVFCLQVLDGGDVAQTNDRLLLGTEKGLYNFVDPTATATRNVIAPPANVAIPYAVTSIKLINATTSAFVTIHGAGVYIYDFIANTWSANLINTALYHRKANYGLGTLSSNTFRSPTITGMTEIRDASDAITGFLLFNETDDFTDGFIYYNGILYADAISPNGFPQPDGDWESVNTETGTNGVNDHRWGWNKSTRPVCNINSHHMIHDANHVSTLLVGKQGNEFVTRGEITGADNVKFQQIYTVETTQNNPCSASITVYANAGFVNTAPQSIYEDNNGLLWFSERDRQLSYSADNGQHFNIVSQASTCVQIDPNLPQDPDCQDDWEFSDCFVITQNPHTPNSNTVFAAINEGAGGNQGPGRVINFTPVFPANSLFLEDNLPVECDGDIVKILFSSATNYYLLVDDGNIRSLRHAGNGEWVEFPLGGNIIDAVISPDGNRIFFIRQIGALRQVCTATIANNVATISPTVLTNPNVLFKVLSLYTYNNNTEYRVICGAEPAAVGTTPDCLFYVYNSTSTILNSVPIPNVCIGNGTPTTIFQNLIDHDNNDNIDGGVTSIEANNQMHQIYVATGGLNNNIFRTHLYKSNINDLNGLIDDCWADITGNLPNKTIQCFSVSSATWQNENLYACVRGLGEWRNEITTVRGTSIVNTEPCIGGSTGVATVTPSDGISPYSILWSTSATTFTATSLQAGNYSYTITDATGFAFHGQITIDNDEDCCGQGIHNINSQADFDNLGPSYDETYNLNADVLISNSVVFTDATFYCAQGRSITVDNSGTLTITSNTELSACGNMWQGIVVVDGGNLVMDAGSTVSDAEYGVRLMNNSTATLYGCILDHNYIHVKIDDNANVNFTSTGTTYSCTDCLNGNPLKQGYAGQTPTPNQITYAGIEAKGSIFNVGVNGADANHFTELYNGLVLTNCYNNVLNTDFKNIRYGVYYLAPGGFAINADMTAGGLLRQFGLGENTQDPPSFENCAIAIRANGGSLTSYFNNMIGMQQGITVLNVKAQNITISMNTIQAINGGISLSGNDLAASIGVSYNNIEVNGISARAISVNEFNNSAANRNFNISCNTINVQDGTDGIFIQTASRVNMTQNNITLNSTTTNSNGIRLQGSNNCTLFENTVVGNGTNRHTCYLASMSPFNTFTNNHADNSNVGFEFNDVCTDNIFKGNTIGLHSIGLHLNSSAIIGQQPPSNATLQHGNKWLQLGNYVVNGAVHESNNLQQLAASEFRVHQPNQGDLYHPTNNHGADWIKVNVAGIPFSLTYANICNAYVANDDESAFRLDTIIAKNKIVTQDFEPEAIYKSTRDLNEKVSANDTMKNDNGIFENFFDSISNTTAGDLANIKLSMQQTLPNFEAIQIMSAAMQIKMDSLVLLDSLINFNSTTQLLVLRNAVRNSLFLIQVQLNLSFDEIKDSLDAKYSILESSNTALQTTNNIEMYEQQINNFRFVYRNATITEVELTSLAQLGYVASLCPYAFGVAVYKARSEMARLGIDTINYDDKANCAILGYLRKAQTNYSGNDMNNSLTVYPNPTKEKLNIILKLKSGSADKIEILNLDGKLLKSHFIKENGTEFELNVTDLDASIYLIKYIGNRSNFVNRFTIIK